LLIQPAHVLLQGENFIFCIYKASHAAPVTCPSMRAHPMDVWEHCTSCSWQHRGGLQ